MPAQNNLSELIIYTSTFYGNDETSEIRSKLCLNLLQKAKEIGVTVVVKDGGSNEKFIDAVKMLDNVQLIQETNTGKKSMGADRRDALEKAIELADTEKMKDPSFFWVEPEKDDLITEQNLAKMLVEIRLGSNVVVPARSEKALKSLPKGQGWFEQRANKRSFELIKEFSGGQHQQSLDLWFGPKLFDLEGAEFFREYNKGHKKLDLWDATIVPVVEAIKNKLKVTSVPVDYEYSEQQRLNESGELKNIFTTKRLEQYCQILKEMGDPLWEKFFERAKDELIRISEIKNEKEAGIVNEELLNEQKRKVLRNFFR